MYFTAQSTGSVDFDDSSVIVVSGTRSKDVGGVEIPDSPKAKVTLDSEHVQILKNTCCCNGEFIFRVNILNNIITIS